MSLRTKLIIIISFGFVGLTAAVFLYTGYAVEKAFTEFEIDNAANTTQLIKDSYAAELEELVRYGAELARQPKIVDAVSSWPDDTEQLIATDDLLNQHVSFFAIVDNQGRIVRARHVNREAGISEEIQPVTLAFISKDNHLRVHHHADSIVKGVALIGETPVLTISVPILPRREGGLIEGAVILGRNWDESKFTALARSNGLQVFYQKIAGPLSKDMKDYYAQAQGLAAGQHTTLLGNHAIATYTIFSDIYQRPSLVIRFTKQRESASAGPQCAMRVAAFSLTGGIVLFLLMMGLLEMTVLKRMRTLVREIKHVKTSDHIADASVTVRGRDEVGKMAHGMRYVLDAMRASRFRWIRAEKRLQELLELSPMGILLAEPVNRRLYRINDAALRILGTRRTDLTGKVITDVFKSIEGVDDLDTVEDSLGDEIQHVRAVVRKGDGSEMAVSLKAGSIRHTEGEMLIFAFVPANGDYLSF